MGTHKEWTSVRIKYALEIQERIVRTLQVELPNEKWDRIQQIVEDNFEKLLYPTGSDKTLKY